MTQPAEPITLAATIDALARRGFTASFEPCPEGLRLSAGTRTYGPAEVTIRESYRFEGVSDPDDLSVVYAIEAADGTRGVLVDAFGAYADPAVARVLRDVAVRATGPRTDATGTGDAA